jgi:hypothetical protein
VYGGFAGSEVTFLTRDPALRVTVLDGHDPTGPSRVYHVVTAASGARLDGFTITGGAASTTGVNSRGGGLLAVSATFEVTRCILADNTAAAEGGGLHVDAASSVTLSDCTFRSNGAVDGAGLHVAGAITVTDATFEDNAATGMGGGFSCVASCDVLRASFTGNRAASGGGMYSQCAHAATITVADSSFEGNVADHGAGLSGLCHEGALDLAGSRFRANLAGEGTGGGAYLSGPHATVRGCHFEENQANSGGGLRLDGLAPTVMGCTFEGNDARMGGGLSSIGPSVKEVTDSLFIGNTAERGAGAWVMDSIDLIRCRFVQNVSSDRGGGVFLIDSVTSNLESCLLADNTAVDGGGLYLERSFVSLVNSTIANNVASGSGGGLFLDGGESSPYHAELDGVSLVIWSNTAPTGAGVALLGTTSVDLTDSLVQGGYPGVGNLDVDPGFVDAVHGDYHLSAGSPCIDTGDDGACPVLDLDGAIRVDVPGVGTPGGFCDLGAYELVP